MNLSRIRRLLHLIHLLQGGRAYDTEALARSCNVSRRTVFREDGSLDFHVTVSGLGEISWWILGYGDQAEVIEPVELRSIVANHAARMMQKYGEPSPTPTCRPAARPRDGMPHGPNP